MRYNEKNYLEAFPREEVKPAAVESAVAQFPEQETTTEQKPIDTKTLETVVEPVAQEGVQDAGAGDMESNS